MSTEQKQPYEEYTIGFNFSKNMASAELISTQTVIAQDKDGVDVSSDFLDQASVTNSGQVVSVLIRRGDVNKSPYKITARCVTDTSPEHKWEKDVIIRVIEI